MMEDNVNTLGSFCTTTCNKNRHLQDQMNKMTIDNSLTIHNNLPTFFKGNTKTCIDDIFSNVPSKIDNVTNHSPLNNKGCKNTNCVNFDSKNIL